VRVTIRNRSLLPLSVERVSVAIGAKPSGRRKVFPVADVTVGRAITIEPRGFVIVETDPDDVVMQRLRGGYVRGVLVLEASGRTRKTRWRSRARPADGRVARRGVVPRFRKCRAISRNSAS
jgi:hypothetical protein